MLYVGWEERQDGTRYYYYNVNDDKVYVHVKTTQKNNLLSWFLLCGPVATALGILARSIQEISTKTSITLVFTSSLAIYLIVFFAYSRWQKQHFEEIKKNNITISGECLNELYNGNKKVRRGICILGIMALLSVMVGIMLCYDEKSYFSFIYLSLSVAALLMYMLIISPIDQIRLYNIIHKK